MPCSLRNSRQRARERTHLACDDMLDGYFSACFFEKHQQTIQPALLTLLPKQSDEKHYFNENSFFLLLCIARRRKTHFYSIQKRRRRRFHLLIGHDVSRPSSSLPLSLVFLFLHLDVHQPHRIDANEYNLLVKKKQLTRYRLMFPFFSLPLPSHIELEDCRSLFFSISNTLNGVGSNQAGREDE